MKRSESGDEVAGAARNELNPAAFRRRLLAWYRGNARSLPWRETSDPYKIWVAEVMLQQTRVAAVVEHYNEFLRRFPTLVSLALASELEVLVSWSGLGYYSRARLLHRAAQFIVTERRVRRSCARCLGSASSRRRPSQALRLGRALRWWMAMWNGWCCG
jgi:endonuclease III